MRTDSLNQFVNLRRSLEEERSVIRQRLQQINQALDGNGSVEAVETPEQLNGDSIPAERKPSRGRRKKRRMSAAGRAAIAAAARKRWAAAKAARRSGL